MWAAIVDSCAGLKTVCMVRLLTKTHEINGESEIPCACAGVRIRPLILSARSSSTMPTRILVDTTSHRSKQRELALPKKHQNVLINSFNWPERISRITSRSRVRRRGLSQADVLTNMPLLARFTRRDP